MNRKIGWLGCNPLMPRYAGLPASPKCLIRLRKPSKTYAFSPIFFKFGRVFSFHSATAFSFRSLALTWGFCGVNPKSRTMCQTQTSLNLSLQTFFITAASRCRVHKSVSNPKAFGPFITAFLKAFRFSGVSEEGKPEFPLDFRAAKPPFSQAAYQRLTAEAVTLNFLAASA